MAVFTDRTHLRANKAVLIATFFFNTEFSQTTVHTKHVQGYVVVDFAEFYIQTSVVESKHCLSKDTKETIRNEMYMELYTNPLRSHFAYNAVQLRDVFKISSTDNKSHSRSKFTHLHRHKRRHRTNLRSPANERYSRISSE